jgi:xanthine dehydrogenase YagR molybdenum-binding subunit
MAPYIGTAISRIDGVAKVTGAAKYAAEFNAPGLLYGSVVTSTIAKGRIVRIDRSAALRVDGVIDVLTHESRPRMADSDQAYKDETAPAGSPFRPLYDDKIMFNGQPVALVVAETSEVARFAASLVRVEYEREAHVTDVYRQRDAAIAVKPPASPFEALLTPPKSRGNAERALAVAAVRHEGEYYVPIEHHNPMELYASTVIFEGGGKFTVYDKTQGVQNVHQYLCGVFGMKPEDVRVMSPFMGGGFGSGLRPQFEVVLAVLAARALQRSVRVVLTRPQMYELGYRPAMIQRIALGANAGGTLDAITHDATTATSQYEDYFRQETGWSGLLYKCANARFAHKLAKLDLATSCDMRAPSAPTAMFALESAMDELAVALKLDPLELRLRCYSERDQNNDRPFTSKALRECYRQGAEAFGWDKRIPEPRSMRDGSDLIGFGMATGIWEAVQMPIAVRIVLTADGHAEVACATSDIGTGTYTIMAQVAADMLGLPVDDISIKLGDSSLPQSPVEGRIVDCGVGV